MPPPDTHTPRHTSALKKTVQSTWSCSADVHHMDVGDSSGKNYEVIVWTVSLIDPRMNSIMVWTLTTQLSHGTHTSHTVLCGVGIFPIHSDLHMNSTLSVYALHVCTYTLYKFAHRQTHLALFVNASQTVF